MLGLEPGDGGANKQLSRLPEEPPASVEGRSFPASSLVVTFVYGPNNLDTSVAICVRTTNDLFPAVAGRSR